jgi:hypothetical protein
MAEEPHAYCHNVPRARRGRPPLDDATLVPAMDYRQVKAEAREMQSSSWRLLRDDRVVADLVVYGGDFPWLNARVFPKEGFEEIRPIFEVPLHAAGEKV